MIHVNAVHRLKDPYRMNVGSHTAQVCNKDLSICPIKPPCVLKIGPFSVERGSPAALWAQQFVLSIHPATLPMGFANYVQMCK